MPETSSASHFSGFWKGQSAGARAAAAAIATMVCAFLLIGLVYNAVAILRLPQSGLETFEIVWVSLTACVLVMVLAMAVAAGLEHLGQALTPKPPEEEWLREQVRRGRAPGMEVRPAGKGGSSSAA